MFSKLKGYFRRLSTPKKEENFEPEPTYYGEVNIWHVSSVVVDNGTGELELNNIILQISYDKTMSDSTNDAMNFNTMISSVGIRSALVGNIDNTTYLFIAGSNSCFGMLLSKYLNDPIHSNNRIFKKVVSILGIIDIMKNVSIFKDEIHPDYYPYEAAFVRLSESRPVYVQYVDTYFVSNKILDAGIDVLDILNTLYIVAVYVNQNILFDYVYDFITKYNLREYSSDILDHIDRYKEKFESNFSIPGYKNIFDINTSITNQEAMSKYLDETEEPID